MSANGNANYAFIPNEQTGPYQQGKVTVVVTEDIAGTDTKWNVDALDFQFNYFMQSGMWMQTILEPSLSPNIFRSNEFQQWAVKPPYQTSNDYQYFGKTLGNNWADGALLQGSILELSWQARTLQDLIAVYEWYCSIRLPNGISDGWLISPEQFPSDWISNTDLLMNHNTETGGTTNGFTSTSVFSIGGIGGGSFFQAIKGAGKIAYSGMHPDPTGNLQAQTAESSNFIYTQPQEDIFGNWIQEFAI